ncbi:cilia- and flagella-associated protein 99 isoform X3 [Harpia harpyja]|uniref:cilia- and flagella-associated protein 99 isoform X3 n=1 Tax=Harpia harpyja TaxID=202280 RepID=UPI0022B0D7D8|nr:cilia- and flagella-associated protein 99 isoform X3 [Harpia harpyja]
MVKMVSHGKHIAIIVQQLNKFNPENQSVEDFLNESAKMLQTLNVTEEKFVLDTLAGCIEYKSLFDVVVNAFFVRDGRYCRISERNLYIVICYLATFQLEELGLQHFSRIVKSLDTAKMQKVPPSTYKPPKEKKQLEEIKTKNRRKAEDLLLKANANQFRCAMMKSEKEENTHDSMKSKPAFQAQKIQSKIDNIPIKLNAAAILREGALYQRKMEQELKRIENLVQGAGDPSEFLEWQKQMRGKDLEEQLAEIECRRLQGKLSHEEAVLAHQNVIQENKKKADLMREEKAELMNQYAEKHLQEQKEMREMVEQVVEGHKNAKQAKIKLRKYKQQIVQEVCEENRELLRQALEEEEEKLRKRYELIQQIRAIESLPSIRRKFVDLTETGGHGLICEMSIVELRERLALLREAQKAAEEEKRDQIIHEKQAKEQLLLDKLDQISLFRAELGRAAALKQEEKKRKSQSGERPMKDERILSLQKKIAEKTMERKKQAGLLKITPQKTSITSRKDSLQWNRWKELEESRERQFKILQHGFMARETAQKMAAYEAARSGATVCILRSEVK